MKRLILAGAILISIQAIGQTKIWEKKLPLTYVKEIIGIKDPATGSFTFIYSTVEEITPVRSDSNFEKSQTGWNTPTGTKFSIPKPDFNRFYIGNLSNGNELTLYYGNASNKSFAYIYLDFETKNYVEGKLDINMEDEKYAQSFSHEGKFHILTSVKGTSKLNLYIYDSSKQENKIELDYSDVKFDHSFKDDVPLYELLKRKTNSLKLSTRLSLATIDQNLPTALSLTSNRCNLYKEGDKVFLTIDNQVKSTVVLSFSLLDYSKSNWDFKFVDMGCGKFESERNINSYVLDGKLYQLSVCSNGLMISIFDLEDDELVKRYSATKDEEIVFSNTDFFLEATNSFTGERKKIIPRDETKKIINKIRRADAGLAVRNVDRNVEMKVGGYQLVEGTQSKGSIPIGSGLSLGIVYKMSDERDYFFKSLFDNTTFEHIKGEAVNDLDQVIGKFKSENKIKYVLETMFSDGSTTYWCYFDERKSTFSLYKL